MNSIRWSMGDVSLHGMQAPPGVPGVLPMSLDSSVTHVPGPYRDDT